jgi:N-carbamoyl-L-amino-acid hydrolase
LTAFDPADGALATDLLARLRASSEDQPGVTRASYGEGERVAHALARDTAAQLGLEIATDFAGNLYMTLPGRDRAAPGVMMGSHMDSVPHGGNYDGAAGVVAGLVALARLRRLGRKPAVDLTVMAIRAEELSWFPAHYIGSRAAFGLLPIEALDLVRFDSGRPLREHMREEGFDPEAVARGTRHLDPKRIGAYVELHIEQGPALVASGHACGIVTGIRGNLRYKHARVLGQYGHAGATPRPLRRDAVFAATEFAQALEALWLEREAAGVDLVCTMGQFFTDAKVHTITKIPGEVRFTMDIRSHDDAVLDDMRARLATIAAGIAQRRGVTLDPGAVTQAAAAVMDADLRRRLHGIAAALRIDAPDIPSGAGHDCAVFAGQGVPCAMIFVRNAHGSHNPDEAMEIADFGEACRLLFGLLDQLA